MSTNQGYPHEYKALTVLLRNFIIRLMDTYGLNYESERKRFVKYNNNNDIVFKLSIDEILKGI